VLVDVEGGDEDLARDLAMHVAASNPLCVSADQVPRGAGQGARDLLGPGPRKASREEIVEKMVEGRVRKYLGEITLLGQPFVKDPDLSVEKLLKQAGARVPLRALEVGEGIEKKADNFADEVMAQARGD
jgi:elongation factor Ts